MQLDNKHRYFAVNLNVIVSFCLRFKLALTMGITNTELVDLVLSIVLVSKERSEKK